MTSGRIICSDCKGSRYRGGSKCAGCDGHGTVESTAAHDALIDALAAVCDPGQARAVLDRLDGNRPLLAAWQHEIGMVRKARVGFKWKPGSDPTVPSWSSKYRDPGLVVCDWSEVTGPDDRYLYMIDTGQ